LPPEYAVTIGIGFKCNDGLVLATDTKYTEGDFKSHGPKLFQLLGPVERPDLAVVIAGAGHVPFMKRAIEDIDSALRALSAPSTENVRTTTESVLVAFYEKHVYPRPSHWWSAEFELILGVWTQTDGYVMLSSNGTTVSPVVTLGTASTCIGLGKHVSEYALALVFQSTLSVENAKFMAAFAIKAAKDYVDSCGGETKIYTLKDDASGFRVHRVMKVEVETAEKYSVELYDTAKYLLDTLDTESIADDESVDVVMGIIKESITDFRKKQKEWKEKMRKLREKKKPTI
jgi:20S proteasome alpha/beta subunit